MERGRGEQQDGRMDGDGRTGGLLGETSQAPAEGCALEARGEDEPAQGPATVTPGSIRERGQDQDRDGGWGREKKDRYRRWSRG